MKKFTLLFLIIPFLSTTNAQTVIFHEEFSGCIDKIAIDEDNDVLWMGTGLLSGGDLYMRDKDGTVTDLSDLNSDINFQSISSLFMDENTLYAAGYGMVGIINPEEDIYTIYTKDNSNLSYTNEFNSLTFDYNSELLYAGNIATGTDILSEDGWTKDNSLKYITASAFDYEEDCLWLANTAGDLIRIKEDVKTIFNQSNSDIPKLPYIDMTLDEEGNIYLMVSQDGFVHFDGTNATHYTPQNSNLFGGELRSIDIDYNGTVWFGHNGGITSFKDGVFKTYPLENALGFFPLVKDIVSDNRNHLWLGICGGLVEFYLEPTNVLNESSITTHLYPNPNPGLFTFESEEDGHLELINTMGQSLEKLTIKKGANSIDINLPSGQYMYRFNGNTHYDLGKLIIH